jgi:low temperature requirement protein LtrA
VQKLTYVDPHRRATWLEGFFDLIFAVAHRDVTHLWVLRFFEIP